MPSSSSVRPPKWEDAIDLYDDGDYSAIWGNYDGSVRRCLGVRWNGGDECGYPNQGSNPLWYVEPDFLTRQMLQALLDAVVSYPANQRHNQYVQNILITLAEGSTYSA